MRAVRLVAPRVYLRAPVESDFSQWEDIRQLSRDFLVPWEPTWAPDALTRRTFRRRLGAWRDNWQAGWSYSFFIFCTQTQTLLGGITLGRVSRGASRRATVGYWMGQPYAGQGYMKDALPVVLRFAFETLTLHRVQAACLPSNKASQAVLVSAGFRAEGLARQYLKINGRWEDHVTFGLLHDDNWRKGPNDPLTDFSTVLQDFGQG